MSRFLYYGFVRYLSRYFRRKKLNVAIQPKSLLTIGSKALIGSQVFCEALKTENRTKIDVEDSLIKACEDGDTAIILLMDTLKEFVIVVCQEYRNCLVKQIEITETASNLGQLSEVWDQLPEYRTLADELKKELNDYMSIFNAIGQMTNEETLVSFISGSTDKIDLVVVKYKELEGLLQKEIAENKIVELKLLQIKRDSILKSVN